MEEYRERRAKIHNDIWDHKMYGFKTKGDALLNKEELTDQQKKTLDEYLKGAEEKQKKRDEYERSLVNSFNEFNEITMHEKFPKDKSEAPDAKALWRSYDAISSKLKAYAFENDKVISGPVIKTKVDEISVDALKKEWIKYQEKLAGGGGGAKKQQQEVASSSIEKLCNVAKLMLKARRDQIQALSDDEDGEESIKTKAQQLQDLAADPQEENRELMVKLLDEIQSTIPCDEKKAPKVKEKSSLSMTGGGKCTNNGCKKKGTTYGTRRCCKDCYVEGELEETMMLILAKERKYFKSISDKEQEKYRRDIKNKYETCLENFTAARLEEKRNEAHQKLQKYIKQALDVLKDIEVDDDHLSSVNDSIVVSSESSRSQSESSESESYSTSSSESEYKAKKKHKKSKKRARDDSEDDDLVKEVLEVSLIGVDEDRKMLLETYKENPKQLKELLSRIRSKRQKKFGVEIYLKANNKKLESKHVPFDFFLSEKEAEMKAQDFCTNDDGGESPFYFKIIPILNE